MIQLSSDQFRSGLRVSASVRGAEYTRLELVDGRWMLTGNCRYTDTVVREDTRVMACEGAVEDFDLITANPVYVRLGGIPDGGRSRNFRDGGYEAGVSVFRAAWDGDTLVVEANAGAILFDTDRPLYEVAGELAQDLGSDDEPVLLGAVLVREIGRDHVRFAR